MAHAAYLGARIQYYQACPSDYLKDDIKNLLIDFGNLFGIELTKINFEDLLKNPHPQRVLSNFLYQSIKNQLLNSSSGVKLNRLRSNFASKSLFLTVYPNGDRSTVMTPEVFKYALRFRFGLPIFSNVLPCTRCKYNGLFNDGYGLHASRCSSNAAMIHNGIIKYLAQEMRLAHLQFQLEPTNLGILNDGISNLRPADILFTPDYDGAPQVAFDFTMVSYHLSDGRIIRARQKIKKYLGGSYQLNPGVNFLPLVVDSLGSFNEHLSNFLLFIAKSQARFTYKPASSHYSRILRDFQFVLFKLLGRVFLISQPVKG